LSQEKQKQGLIEQNQPIFSGAYQWKDRIVLSSTAGDWDIQMLQDQARFTSPVQQNWIRDPENLKDFIAGLVVRSYILKQARTQV
jgi:hypothetical protein